MEESNIVWEALTEALKVDPPFNPFVNTPTYQPSKQQITKFKNRLIAFLQNIPDHMTPLEILDVLLDDDPDP